ncbi:atherin-like [Meriones unguiculatus]|uniref:atherin-like n=1 Tax=Meriones unguiculatus TaxID=10047 RepID=UPI00293F2849|nr:atherin-like [Meriones unguiculatus]
MSTAAGSALLLCIIAAAAAVRRTRRAVGARAAAGAGRAPGRPKPGPALGRAAAAGAGRGPVRIDGSSWAGDSEGGVRGSLSRQSHPPGAPGPSSVAGRMSSRSPPLASLWGSSAEALKAGGRVPSWARRAAARHLCDLAGKGAQGT